MWIRNEITHHVRFWYCSDVALIEGGGGGRGGGLCYHIPQSSLMSFNVVTN